MKGTPAKLFVMVFLLSILTGIVMLIVRPDRPGGSQARKPGQDEKPKPMRRETHASTLIVPTLSEALPAGKNVLWCASFQMAWDRLKNDVVRGPISVEGAEEISEALNTSPFAEADLPDGAWYASAGVGRESIARIREEMAARFPKFAPELPEGHAEFIAYAYLKAGVVFDPPYFDARKPLAFREASGGEAAVNAFGIRAEDEYAYHALRQRIEVAFVKHDPNGRVEEMVVDPCRTSAPNQILLALIPRKASLKEAWEHVRTRLLPDGPGLGPNDTMLVPNVLCEIVEDFEALTDKSMRAAGQRLKFDIARQAINFRLNRGGAELGSEAKAFAAPIPVHYHFDRPFLIAMRKRGSAAPFFLMWVENREVLK